MKNNTAPNPLVLLLFSNYTSDFTTILQNLQYKTYPFSLLLGYSGNLVGSKNCYPLFLSFLSNENKGNN